MKQSSTQPSAVSNWEFINFMRFQLREKKSNIFRSIYCNGIVA